MQGNLLRIGKWTSLNKIKLLPLRIPNWENRKVLTPKNNKRQILINFIIISSYSNWFHRLQSLPCFTVHLTLESYWSFKKIWSLLVLKFFMDCLSLSRKLHSPQHYIQLLSMIWSRFRSVALPALISLKTPPHFLFIYLHQRNYILFITSSLEPTSA